MLKMVLKAGYDVNLKNSNGDTVFHVAAKLGDLKCLELIYETGMCDLNIQNNDKLTALGISVAKFKEADYLVMKLFNNWTASKDTDNDKIQSIVSGRVKCHTFLKKKMHADYITRNNRVCDQTNLTNIGRQAKARIIRGMYLLSLVVSIKYLV